MRHFKEELCHRGTPQPILDWADALRLLCAAPALNSWNAACCLWGKVSMPHCACREARAQPGCAESRLWWTSGMRTGEP